MSNSNYTAYKGAEPYFKIVREALGDLVDGDHFFDIVTEHTIYEVLYELGWPRIIHGRTELMHAFRGYIDIISLQSADHLAVHTADSGRVIVIEYEVHGTVLATGKQYDNRFCSILRLENQKIVHWRDYMDSHAAWNALAGR